MDSKEIEENLLEYLETKEVRDALQQMNDKYQLSQKGFDIRLFLSHVLEGRLELERIPLVLAEVYGLDYKMAFQLASELYDKVWYEIDDILEEKRAAFLEFQKTLSFAPLDELSLAREKADGMKMPTKIEELVAEIIAESNVSLKEQWLRKRLENIITLFIKEVRSLSDTHSQLVRSAKIGGLGLSAEQADKILELAKKKFVEYHQGMRSDSSSLREEAGRSERKSPLTLSSDKSGRGEILKRVPLTRGTIGGFKDPPLSSSLSMASQKSDKKLSLSLGDEAELSAGTVDLNHQLAQSAAENAPQQESGDTGLTYRRRTQTVTMNTTEMPGKPRPEVARKEAETSSFQQEKDIAVLGEEASAIQKNVEPILASKPKQDDEKSLTPSTGPGLIDKVEEIELMRLEDFRHLGTPREAVTKIEEKIHLLEEEKSFSGRLQGIAAWQKNELYALYVDLGKESLAGGDSIEEIIAERAEQGKPTLTPEEFRAIMKLNQKLRF